MIERRQFARRRAVHRKILAFVTGSGLLVKVNDISSGGLRIVTSERIADRPRDRLVDIFAASRPDFILPSLPCRIIYDLQHLSEDETFSGSATRIVGLKFQLLTRSQRGRLDALLRILRDPD